MKQLQVSLVAIALIISSLVRADEGMWLPFMLNRNYSDMKKHGLRLSQDQIYSINKSSLKDAVISFGGFCTGEIISKSGLILTNHHCGYDAIASSSTPEHNYLDNGFWAKNNKEEIPIPGLTATFIIRMEDVTSTITKELNANMTSDQRNAKIREISAILEKDAVNGTNYEAFVRDFYDGNEFYLFVKETYNDIRLVGTPPQSAGKFGGDTDNWMWPRHTADFSMFRIYAGADNKPAKYSETNIPYKPKHSLPISLQGVKENDFAMIMGFPGRTNRYLTSFGVEQAITIEQPKIVDIRAKKLEIMKKYMDKDVAVRLNYSSKYAQVANYWKYFIGQTAQLKANKVADKKRALESEFFNYAKDKPEYFGVLDKIKSAYDATNNYVYIRVYQSEFVRQVDLNMVAFMYKVAQDQEEKNPDRAKMIRMSAMNQAESLFSERSMDIELDILQEVLKMYMRDIPADQQGEFVKKIGLTGVDAFIKNVRENSVFTDKARFEAFVEKGDYSVLENDPLFKLIQDLDNAYGSVSKMESLQEANEKLAVGNRLFVKAIREMQPNKKFYPNANSTMRLTYGNVLPYDPKDGVTYHYYTTLDGVMEKEDPSNPEFAVDERIKEVYKNKDYGQYADKKTGNLVVNFLTNNDITGGNSGSPVINGKGQLIGTAFDGNWEAMSGDIYFEPNIQRTISLDIRYTLWLVDKCYGAKNLIDEMELIK